MESSLNQNELLDQLKQLRAEKASLEKHVFMLNECLSVDELKDKIAHLEKKQEMLVQLENLMERLRDQVEPLRYLKMTLETKLLFESQMNQCQSKSFNESKPMDSKFDSDLAKLDIFKTLPVSKSLHSENTQKISPGLTNSDMRYFMDLSQTVPTPTSTNSMSIVNDESLDEATQLLEQYDVVTDQEILNFSENHSKAQSINQEPIASTSTMDVANEIPNEEKAMTSACFDAENTDVQMENKEAISIKENTIIESSVNKVVHIDSKNVDEIISQLHEAIIHDMNSSIRSGLLSASEKNSVSINTINTESTEQTIESTHNETVNVNDSNKSINSFNDMNLKIDILRGIYSLGFVNPTALQQRIIVQCINGRDVIVFAGPGNGRTMMFTIPLLQRLRTNLHECQALILVPSRDLAVHIQKIIMSVGDFLGINICVGGDNIPKKLSVVPHVVVGTPAGVFNMIACKSLNTRCVQTVVINKADKMLTSNYPKLIQDILAKLEKNKQVTVLTSDKLDHVLDLYMDILRDPLVIINDDDKEKDDLKHLPKQFYLNTQEDWKLNALCEMNETLKTQKVIIFCNTLERAQKLCKTLQRLEYAVSLFHLEINAHEREAILEMFSLNALRMIITTDPIKGNQFQQAAWIINYDLPINPICYLDRINKCAENIKVLNLISENDDQVKLAIETHNNSYMIQMPMNLIDLLQY